MIDNESSNVDRLEELIYETFDEIYEERDINSIRNNLSLFSDVFHNIGDSSIIILIKILLESQRELNEIKITHKKMERVTVKKDVIHEFIMNDMKKNIKLHFLNHQRFDCGLGKKKLYNGLLQVFHDYLASDIKDDASIIIGVAILINLWEISSKDDLSHEFYIMYNSFMHKLSLRDKFQDVRDLSEQALVLSHINKKLHYGFFIRTSTFSRQHNIIDSLISANLLLHGYKYTHHEDKVFLSKVLLELFILFRNFGLYPYAEEVYKAHGRLNVGEKYDKHQFSMAYYNMLLLKEDSRVFDLVEADLGENNALEFGVQSAIPWLALLLNLKMQDEEKFSSLDKLKLALEEIEKNDDYTNHSLIINFKSAMSESSQENKKELIKKIREIENSTSYQDVSYELTTIYPLVKKLLINSIRESDIEGALLAHSLSSDSEGINITERNSGMGYYEKNFFDNLIKGFNYDDYQNKLMETLRGNIGKTMIWVGVCAEFLYSIKYENEEWSLKHYKEISSEKLISWDEKNTSLLAFDDNPNTSSIYISKESIWQEDSDKIKSNCFTSIDEIKNDEVVIFRDAKISRYPINMLKTERGDIFSEKFSLTIADSVRKYVKNESYFCDIRKIKLWAPIKEGDIAINIAYSKIKEECASFDFNCFEGVYPEPEQNQDVNIFISHGGKHEIYGFNSISPAEDIFYLDEKVVFGKGKVAILFICHSGSSKAETYATKINTLVSKVLSLGYEAVLAPAWSYNVILPGIWTKEFLNSISSGLSISVSNFRANEAVKEIYPSIGAYAAMHFFGNDKVNIMISE